MKYKIREENISHSKLKANIQKTEKKLKIYEAKIAELSTQEILPISTPRIGQDRV